METITLYFRQGSSDKIYQAAIEPKDGGFTVNFAYGRRGSTLSTGTKTQSPVLQGIRFRVRRTGNGQNGAGRRGVRGSGEENGPSDV